MRLRTEGDDDTRVRIRIEEIDESPRLVQRLLAELPDGPTRAELPAAAATCEATTLVEGFCGDLLVYVRLGADARIERCHMRDPSWFQ